MSVERDLALLHRLQQCGLRLRRGTIDLVAQYDLGEHRARPELDPAALPGPDANAGDVRRQQVGCELDPPERAPERPGQRLGEHGLADAGDVLDEDVAFGEHRGDQQPDDFGLALDHPLDGLGDAREVVGEGLEGFRGGTRHGPDDSTESPFARSRALPV